ncbi:MAG TPA: UDP-N-acetylglucosamine--N-acetylmuramyl-(pentapeptide) pyrophosphoryl-undecaprenol N-acetylglucosamine transferase, partial [Deinococcales bacterium]|nr:UDP-N-acetylglucosamine--N-acetylmuramyl-(pentapeptide) pyrophosphoryl-undecaprenol N-acetylglucosamine transferase [Deinococcales bacterium]
MSGPVVLTAGGTGGHIFPAVAVARELKARGVAVVLVGASGGMEERVAAQEGLDFAGVRAGKLDRERPSPRALAQAAGGLLDAWRLLRRLRPRVVVGFGGFASVPASVAAALTGTPLVLHDSNAYPGLVTRLLARRAAVVALGDEAARARLPGARATWVGMPTREARPGRADALAR